MEKRLIVSNNEKKLDNKKENSNNEDYYISKLNLNNMERNNKKNKTSQYNDKLKNNSN